MTRYVVGFAFSGDGDTVVLIRKNRPEWQKGKLNGVGGHIEPGETPQDAMSREFEEETGVSIGPSRWDYFVTVHGDNFEVFFFRTFTDEALSAKTTTDETVELFSLYDIRLLYTKVANALSNLTWLIPLALDANVGLDKICNKR